MAVGDLELEDHDQTEDHAGKAGGDDGQGHAEPSAPSAAGPNQQRDHGEQQQRREHGRWTHAPEAAVNRTEDRRMQRVPVRDVVEESDGLEIAVDALRCPTDVVLEPLPPSVVQFLLDVPGHDPIGLNLPLLQTLQHAGQVQFHHPRGARGQVEVPLLAGYCPDAGEDVMQRAENRAVEISQLIAEKGQRPRRGQDQDAVLVETGLRQGEEFAGEVTVRLQIGGLHHADENDIIGLRRGGQQQPAVPVLQAHPRIAQLGFGQPRRELPDHLEECGIVLGIGHAAHGRVLQDFLDHAPRPAPQDQDLLRKRMGQHRQMHELLDEQHVRNGRDDLGDAVQEEQILALVFQNGNIAVWRVPIMHHVVPRPLHPDR